KSWQASRAQRAPWLSYEAALQAASGLSVSSSSPSSADEKKGCSDRATAQFALSVLVDMGDVIRIGRNIVICDPSWLSRAISSLVLPGDSTFQGIPEGKDKECMDNGVASAETLCKFLVKRGRVPDKDSKN